MSRAESQDGEKRSDERAPIVLHVDYKRLNTFFADYTKNISKGGTFIRTTRPLEVGTAFIFILGVPTGARSTDAANAEAGSTVQLELSAVVKWVIHESEATEDKPAGMGIQFVFANAEEREHVESIVSGMMHDALGPRLAEKLLSRKT
ncbi:MAG: PilZ domain-containing protein [Polyangiaceae bacterium]|nr:PilZ domain-containing protein [Polyangiaceae bacterium]